MAANLRSIGALLLGFVVGSLIIATTEFLGTLAFPELAIERADPEIAALPVAALVYVAMCSVVGTFVGAWSAAKTAGRAPFVHAAIIGAIFLIAGAIEVASLPGHPLWFVPAAFPSMILAAAVGGLLARGRKADVVV